MKEQAPMGCLQLVQMKQCSCQVCPLYSSFREPAEAEGAGDKPCHTDATKAKRMAALPRVLLLHTHLFEPLPHFKQPAPTKRGDAVPGMTICWQATHWDENSRQ